MHTAPGADDGLCPLHHQFHGVSGPQMSSTAHSRGQNTVVGQVLWGQTVDAFEDRHGHLKVNSMSSRKPMKVAQYWCYVVILPGASHHTSCRVLDGLELLHQAVTDTEQQ